MSTASDHALSEAGVDLAALRARLVPPMPSRLWGWLGPLLVTLFGGYLRFFQLSQPHSVIFDETYYVADALGILKYGTEHNYVSTRNNLLIQGNPHIFTSGGEFVAHPPFGKVLIAAGEWLFGLNPFGWRVAAAVVGTLSILLIARIARRMTRSTLLGCAAGLLLSLDGLEFVMSRTALLDIFVMFWALAAFGCVVVDRDSYRARLAREVETAGAEPRGWFGQWWRGIRWWRVGAGVCLGLACGSKWNGIWFVPAFALLVLAWDIGARRVAQVRSGGALARDLAGLAGSFGLLPLLTYLATWSGWLFTSTGFDRQWAVERGVNIPVLSPLISLFEYNKAMLAFNTSLRTPHVYASKPWTWLILKRPVAYYWVCPASGHGGCSAGDAREVLALGTPLLWWGSILTLTVCLIWWLTRRDWRAAGVLTGVAVGWLPWFLFSQRTQFYFYAVVFVPYLVLSITLCLGLVIGRARAPAWRRALGAGLAGAFVLGVLANFWYLYPILTGQPIPYGDWWAHMWFTSWV